MGGGRSGGRAVGSRSVQRSFASDGGQQEEGSDPSSRRSPVPPGDGAGAKSTRGKARGPRSALLDWFFWGEKVTSPNFAATASLCRGFSSAQRWRLRREARNPLFWVKRERRALAAASSPASSPAKPGRAPRPHPQCKNDTGRRIPPSPSLHRGGCPPRTPGPRPRAPGCGGRCWRMTDPA